MKKLVVSRLISDNSMQHIGYKVLFSNLQIDVSVGMQSRKTREIEDENKN